MISIGSIDHRLGGSLFLIFYKYRAHRLALTSTRSVYLSKRSHRKSGATTVSIVSLHTRFVYTFYFFIVSLHLNLNLNTSRYSRSSGLDFYGLRICGKENTISPWGVIVNEIWVDHDRCLSGVCKCADATDKMTIDFRKLTITEVRLFFLLSVRYDWTTFDPKAKDMFNQLLSPIWHEYSDGSGSLTFLINSTFILLVVGSFLPPVLDPQLSAPYYYGPTSLLIGAIVDRFDKPHRFDTAILTNSSCTLQWATTDKNKKRPIAPIRGSLTFDRLITKCLWGLKLAASTRAALSSAEVRQSCCTSSESLCASTHLVHPRAPAEFQQPLVAVTKKIKY